MTKRPESALAFFVDDAMPMTARVMTGHTIRRLMLAALITLLALPLLGWWLGELRIFVSIAITVASLWWLMAGWAMWQQRRRADV